VISGFIVSSLSLSVRGSFPEGDEGDLRLDWDDDAIGISMLTSPGDMVFFGALSGLIF